MCCQEARRAPMEPQGLFPVTLTAGRRQFMGQDHLRMSGRLSLDMFNPIFRQAQRADDMIIISERRGAVGQRVG